MLKEYQMPDGSTWQFDEGTQPSEAVEVEAKAEKAPAKKVPAKKAE